MRIRNIRFWYKSKTRSLDQIKTSSLKKFHEKNEAAGEFLEKKSLEKLRKQNLYLIRAQ